MGRNLSRTAVPIVKKMTTLVMWRGANDLEEDEVNEDGRRVGAAEGSTNSGVNAGHTGGGSGGSSGFRPFK